MTPKDRAFMNRDISLTDLQDEADRIHDAFELHTIIGNGGKDICCERQLQLTDICYTTTNYEIIISGNVKI